MTEALLPPDPSKDGWYWVRRISNPNDVQAWHWKSDQWVCVYTISAGIAGLGWALASPHPIPGPEQLNALHALSDILRDRANKAVAGPTERRVLGYELFGRAGGIVDTFREAANVLNEAIMRKL